VDIVIDEYNSVLKTNYGEDDKTNKSLRQHEEHRCDNQYIFHFVIANKFIIFKRTKIDFQFSIFSYRFQSINPW
jgi:hypothetical protein